MTSNLRIYLSNKTERLRFSGTQPLNFLTAMLSYLSSLGGNRSKFEADMSFHINLNSNCQNLSNVSYAHKRQFVKICLTKLRRKTV